MVEGDGFSEVRRYAVTVLMGMDRATTAKSQAFFEIDG
jgi:hypothetical protein